MSGGGYMQQPRQMTPYTGSGIRAQAPMSQGTDNFSDVQTMPTPYGAEMSKPYYAGAADPMQAPQNSMGQQNPLARMMQQNIGGFGMPNASAQGLAHGTPFQGGGFAPPGMQQRPQGSSVDPRTGKDLPPGVFADPVTGQISGQQPQAPKYGFTPAATPSPYQQPGSFMYNWLNAGANPNWANILNSRGNF